MPRVRTAVVVVLALAALAGCGGSGKDTGAAVASGDPSACPGDVVDVVVSVGQWGDVVRRLGGDCATVTTIVASGAVDPHDFDPSTSDLAAFSSADLVVLNGAGYDRWAEDAVAAADSPAVVSAAEVSDVPDEGADPHLWYSPDAVQSLAAAVTARLSSLDRDAAGYFADRAAEWQTGLEPYLAAVEQLRTTAAGHTFAATETVFDRMAAAVGLTDVTPEGFRRAASNESEPAPGDLAAFESALRAGTVDVLIYNTQTSGSVPAQLRSTAEDAGVPVVEVTESPADAGSSFVAWQLDQLDDLSKALQA